MKKGKDYIGNTVVFICHDGAGNYLLSKRSDNCRDEQGTWDCGGGGIELGDTAEKTVADEISQEYCAQAQEIEFLGYRDVFRTNANGEETHWVALDFKVLIDPSTVANGEPHKFEELVWFRLDALPSPLHSQLPYTIEKYRERL